MCVKIAICTWLAVQDNTEQLYPTTFLLNLLQICFFILSIPGSNFILESDWWRWNWDFRTWWRLRLNFLCASIEKFMSLFMYLRWIFIKLSNLINAIILIIIIYLIFNSFRIQIGFLSALQIIPIVCISIVFVKHLLPL